MEELFSSGRIADIVIALMAVEAAGLLYLRSKTGRGLPPKQIIATLAAGVCLFVALRLALTGADWTQIAFALAASLVAHLADLRSRWNSR